MSAGAAAAGAVVFFLLLVDPCIDSLCGWLHGAAKERLTNEMLCCTGFLADGITKSGGEEK